MFYSESQVRRHQCLARKKCGFELGAQSLEKVKGIRNFTNLCSSQNVVLETCVTATLSLGQISAST